MPSFTHRAAAGNYGHFRRNNEYGAAPHRLLHLPRRIYLRQRIYHRRIVTAHGPGPAQPREPPPPPSAMAYFNQHNRGDMLSRLTSDLDAVGETLREGIPGMISAFIGIVGAVSMMIWISPKLAAIILSVIVVGVLGLTFTAKKARTIYLRKQEALGAVNGGIEELISGKQIVQAFGLEKITTDNLSELNTRLFTRERSPALWAS